MIKRNRDSPADGFSLDMKVIGFDDAIIQNIIGKPFFELFQSNGRILISHHLLLSA